MQIYDSIYSHSSTQEIGHMLYANNLCESEQFPKTYDTQGNSARSDDRQSRILPTNVLEQVGIVSDKIFCRVNNFRYFNTHIKNI